MNCALCSSRDWRVRGQNLWSSQVVGAGGGRETSILTAWWKKNTLSLLVLAVRWVGGGHRRRVV